jgi:hypothetical protein
MASFDRIEANAYDEIADSRSLFRYSFGGSPSPASILTCLALMFSHHLPKQQ